MRSLVPNITIHRFVYRHLMDKFESVVHPNPKNNQKPLQVTTEHISGDDSDYIKGFLSWFFNRFYEKGVNHT